MNKYIKLAIEKKLEDNGIGIGDKFKVDCWAYNDDYYIYDGDDIYCNYYDYIVDMVSPYNFKDFINSEINKIIDVKKVDFETAFKMMSGYRDESINNEDVVSVYVTLDKGEFSKIWFTRMKHCEVDHEFVATDPEMNGIKFSNLCDYEFYVKG